LNNVVSLITYSDLPDLDPDDQLLQAALARRGWLAQALVWDDARVDWTDAGVCVLRSTWDYHRKFEKFSAWLKHVADVTTLLNPLELVLWNTRKTYLHELTRAGLPVITTRYVSADQRAQLSGLLEEMGWQEAIIKPSIGLATSGVKRIERNAASISEGEAHLDLLLATSEAMVQEFMPSVHDYGERSLIFIDGRFSHCVRKAAFQKLACAGHAGETVAEAAGDEIAIAQHILNYLKVIPLYARVDLVRDRKAQPVLMELELVEPSLFLKTCPEAAEPFADAIVRRASRLSSSPPTSSG
jgi:glutathione synthase/RimK-type ligase-like ATP-grasp enzyme